MKTIKHLFFGTIAAIIAIGFILLSLELFLRINKKIWHITTSYRVNTSAWLEGVLLQKKRHSSLLGFENIPNAGGVNSYGLVSREYKLKKGKDTFRILILGDSIAEGFDNCLFESLINESPVKRPNYKYEVWNGGVGAYDVRRYYLYLKNRGLHYKPDLVFIFFCLNDFDIDTSVYYKDEKGAIKYNFHSSSGLMRRYTPNPFLMRYSYLYRFIILRLNSYMLSMEEKRCGVSSEQEEGLYYLKEIKDLCDKNHLPLFAVVFPYLKPLSEYYSYQQKQYGIITHALKDLDITYLDLHRHLPQEELVGLRMKKEDEMHPSLEGYRLMARIICNNFFGQQQK